MSDQQRPGPQDADEELGTAAPRVERWGCFEYSVRASVGQEVEGAWRATFSQAGRQRTVQGFGDGEGTWRVRFMPDELGEWHYRTVSEDPALDGHEGSFECVPPGPTNHGPVRVREAFHFAYADGAPYRPFGTTCYAWSHQPDALRRETLESIATSPFDKLRMCIFPKRYIYNEDEPELHAFARRPDGSLDFDCFEPAFFHRLEACVGQLRDLGVEADLILFHPYDTWGYQGMTPAQDERYLRHVMARLSAYRNVWWSVANEFDLMAKPAGAWDRYLEVIRDADPYGHLVSIHNADRMFDHRHPVISHVSVQSWDVKRTREWVVRFGKPVINDEPEYEGDVPLPWGSISAHELVHRFWITALNGGYAGHGETYLDPQDVLWWSKGGRLHGASPPRIAFLRRLMEEAGAPLEPLAPSWVWTRVSAARAADTWLYYFGEHQPRRWTYGLPEEDGDYVAELIDPWAMTITPLEIGPRPALTGLPGSHEEQPPSFSVDLPGKPYLALRITRR